MSEIIRLDVGLVRTPNLHETHRLQAKLTGDSLAHLVATSKTFAANRSNPQSQLDLINESKAIIPPGSKLVASAKVKISCTSFELIFLCTVLPRTTICTTAYLCPY